jgi:hypothetical protein
VVNCPFLNKTVPQIETIMASCVHHEPSCGLSMPFFQVSAADFLTSEQRPYPSVLTSPARCHPQVGTWPGNWVLIVLVSLFVIHGKSSNLTLLSGKLNRKPIEQI